MDREKYPNYFLAVVVVYAIVFLIGFGYFIAPASSFGLAYSDFYLISAMFLAPLVLLAVYEKSSRFQFLWGKEHILRFLITVLTLIDFVIVLYLMILLI